MKKIIQFVLPILVLSVGAIFWFNQHAAQPIEDHAFQTIDGQSMKISDYAGKPLLVIFWATDCPGCIAEMPALIALHEQYDELGMLGIALPHDTPAQIKAMRAAKSLPYTLTWDADNSLSAVFGQVRVTPTHFLLDEQGQIVMRKIGELDFALLQQRLEEMGLSPA
ncbi:Cytochrome c-type biogenesis protein ResA [Methylophaga frappieri]|uniref:Cytochrome c-type biogenesis protein ResA n=1 Tax=Methylophaga frappieri (strain ATCC BAA-2434 / DSM 25690 / JAM7) TaxID=754477 RepID=I1YHE4_METFJ|nr:TlpA disulfide reductase family protein [Methylophaga frappieri]AFJ02337.1 Cytochrome c-type biogenesis protein ResA [Methylophaga frappieri]